MGFYETKYSFDEFLFVIFTLVTNFAFFRFKLILQITKQFYKNEATRLKPQYFLGGGGGWERRRDGVGG